MTRCKTGDIVVTRRKGEMVVCHSHLLNGRESDELIEMVHDEVPSIQLLSEGIVGEFEYDDDGVRSVTIFASELPGPAKSEFADWQSS